MGKAVDKYVAVSGLTEGICLRYNLCGPSLDTSIPKPKKPTQIKIVVEKGLTTITLLNFLQP